MIKKIVTFFLLLALIISCGACGRGKKEKKEITVLAAASLTDVMGELKELYEKQNKKVSLVFSFGSSGALQAQIEEGAPADIFFSASEKQMDVLREKGLMRDGSIVNLLENSIVLIVPKGNPAGLKEFGDMAKESVKMVGLGDPDSVPAGQYAKEALIKLGIEKEVLRKANFGNDVRSVLNWVGAGECDCGVVYATDAAIDDRVETVCAAPEGSCKKVIYPAGVTKDCGAVSEAEAFLSFLKTREAAEIFVKYGFII